MDWETVKANLKTMGTPYQEREADPALVGFISQCGYDAAPMVVDISGIEDVDADIGVIVTDKNQEANNGVYVFCVLRDNSLGLVTVIPSTVSRGPMLRKVAGDVTNAISGVPTPPLMAFDMIEVAGQVLANTVMADLAAAYNIPKGKKKAFITMYLPKFLANVAYYYTGAVTKDNKPVVTEEIANMEPALVKRMVLGENCPEIFTQEEKTDGGQGL